MTMDRSIQVLVTGLRAAHERMFRGTGLNRPEYPRDFQRLYGFAEDSFDSLFDAVRHKKFDVIRECAADIIVTASKIIEYAELMQKVSDKPWDTEE